jgi:hypothetical protein
LAEYAVKFERVRQRLKLRKLNTAFRAAKKDEDIKQAIEMLRRFNHRELTEEHLQTSTPSAGGYLLLKTKNLDAAAQFIADVCRVDVTKEEVLARIESTK